MLPSQGWKLAQKPWRLQLAEMRSMSWARTLVSEMATTSTDDGRPTEETRSYKEEFALGLTVINAVKAACEWQTPAESLSYDGDGRVFEECSRIVPVCGSS